MTKHYGKVITDCQFIFRKLKCYEKLLKDYIKAPPLNHFRLSSGSFILVQRISDNEHNCHRVNLTAKSNTKTFLKLYLKRISNLSFIHKYINF